MAFSIPKKVRYAAIRELPHVVQPSRKDLLYGPFPLRGHWSTEFFKNANPLTLELGCGRGEYTVQMARALPQHNFVGLDIKGARLFYGAHTVAAEGLRNAAFLRADADLLAGAFALGELSEIWLTFPDPQYKKPQKCLLSPPRLARYRDLLRPGGLLHLKTDTVDLYNMLLTEAPRFGFVADLHTANLDDHAYVVGPGVTGIVTRFEQRYRQAGETIKYVKMVRTSS